jgi:hypothetical protein
MISALPETLGIRQDAQGRGIGTRLIAPGLARGDHASLASPG